MKQSAPKAKNQIDTTDFLTAGSFIITAPAAKVNKLKGDINMKLKGDINMKSKAAPPPDLTKEQVEALKRLGGIDEFYPTMWEVQQAGEIFKAEMSRWTQRVASGDTSADVALDIAASKVWSQARRYQSEKQAAQTAAEQTKPGGIKRLLRFLHGNK